MGPVEYFVHKNIFAMSMPEDGEKKHSKHVFLCLSLLQVSIYTGCSHIIFETPNKGRLRCEPRVSSTNIFFINKTK